MTRKLYQSELETVVEWFMYHMSQEQRGQLMGDLPRHYQMLTGAATGPILAAVKKRLEEADNWKDPLGRSKPPANQHIGHDGA